MAYTIRLVEVWAGDIMNRPGTLARVLEALTQGGVDLEFLVARRVNENTSRVFLAPIKGKKQKQAAADVGLQPASGLHSIRVQGPDRKGLGSKLTRAVAAADLNIRGASAATIGKKNVFYMAFAEENEAKAAARVAKKALAKKK